MRIYLFRGLFGGGFSTGIDRLAEKLSARGHTTSVHRWWHRPRVQSQILDAGNSSDGQSLSIIGHSLGGNSANYLANDLADAGVRVAYVATIDPTAPKSAPDGPISDNFRSSDPRDRPVPGANEFNFPDLSHIQIDKDERVHNQILSRCANTAFTTGTAIIAHQSGDITMPNFETRASGISEIGGSATSNNPGGNNFEQLLADLLSQLQNHDSSQNPSASLRQTDIQTIIDSLPPQEETRRSPILTAPDPDITPVNNWLGPAVGKLLNGRKTGLGVLGLVATFVLPTIFPGIAPVQDILRIIGMTNEAIVGADTDTGTKILGPLFAGLGGWGILGKIEKWVTRIKERPRLFNR